MPRPIARPRGSRSCRHRLSSLAVAGYLRHRVAAADPGQFDEASAKALASATRFHRFARWGRQWIKRSTVAHLVVVLALVNQLPVLAVSLGVWRHGGVRRHPRCGAVRRPAGRGRARRYATVLSG